MIISDGDIQTNSNNVGILTTLTPEDVMFHMVVSKNGWSQKSYKSWRISGFFSTPPETKLHISIYMEMSMLQFLILKLVQDWILKITHLLWSKKDV